MATALPRYNYIISKYLDPLFALSIGVSAAAVRIRREEKAKGRSLEETWEVGVRRLKYSVGLETTPFGDRAQRPPQTT